MILYMRLFCRNRINEVWGVDLVMSLMEQSLTYLHKMRQDEADKITLILCVIIILFVLNSQAKFLIVYMDGTLDIRKLLIKTYTYLILFLCHLAMIPAVFAFSFTSKDVTSDILYMAFSMSASYLMSDIVRNLKHLGVNIDIFNYIINKIPQGSNKSKGGDNNDETRP